MAVPVYLVILLELQTEKTHYNITGKSTGAEQQIFNFFFFFTYFQTTQYAHLAHTKMKINPNAIRNLGAIHIKRAFPFNCTTFPSFFNVNMLDGRL